MPSSKIRCYTYLTGEESRRVAANAALCGKTMSAFLRDLALGWQPVNVLPQEQFEELIGLRADLRRLGNMLKSSAFSNTPRIASALVPKIEDTVNHVKMSRK